MLEQSVMTSRSHAGFILNWAELNPFAYNSFKNHFRPLEAEFFVCRETRADLSTYTSSSTSRALTNLSQTI